MFYHKREFPEWAKWAGLALLLIAAFAAGYRLLRHHGGYSLYLDMRDSRPGRICSSAAPLK